jgi:uncharacterized protein YdcH (DUF465 family)
MTQQPAWRLRNLRRLLHARLREEQRKSRPNSFTVQTLKQRKLQVKDALAQAQAHA